MLAVFAAKQEQFSRLWAYGGRRCRLCEATAPSTGTGSLEQKSCLTWCHASCCSMAEYSALLLRGRIFSASASAVPLSLHRIRQSSHKATAVDDKRRYCSPWCCVGCCSAAGRSALPLAQSRCRHSESTGPCCHTGAPGRGGWGWKLWVAHAPWPSAAFPAWQLHCQTQMRRFSVCCRDSIILR